MTEIAAAVPAARPEVVRRASVTALLVLVSVALPHVPLPFLAPGALWNPRTSVLPIPIVSVVHVGLAPIFVAFVLVELVALAAPALRARRNGSAAERAGLTRAAWFLGIAFAAFEAGRTVVFLGGQVTPQGGRFAFVALAVTLTAGAALLCSLALAVDRHGLGNGFAVLLAAQVVAQLPHTLLTLPELSRDGGVVLPLALELAALAIVLRLMRGDSRRRVRVAIPTCGLVPWFAAYWAVVAPSYLPAWLVSADARQAMWDLVVAHRNALEIAAAIAFALLFLPLFSAGGRVAASWSAANPADGAEPDEVAAATARAHRTSILLVAFGAALPFVSQSFGNSHPWILGVFGPVMVGAAVMDLVAEATARARLGPLVSAFPLHRVHAVEPALAALSQAGIPAAARARYFRALFHFFAPFAPIEILVPPEFAAEAAAICARVARPESAAAPAAEVASA